MMAAHALSSGKKVLIPLLFLCICISSPAISRQSPPPNASGSLHIIAVMVEFEADDIPYTSGDGTFNEGSLPYLENPGTNIDPLPHNQSYFEAHLEFAKNYFEKNSANLLSVTYQVLPDIYKLENSMDLYSPVGENPELNSLAVLAKDAWEKVSEDENIQLNPPATQNIAFIIFHAGVGRDIELSGTNLDRTPQDIPSVYLSTQAFRDLLQDPSFSGFSLNQGNLLVNNTLILPRTLSRAGEDISGNPFIIPLSINGMVTAQLGSHIGLPDLFNTNTGESGIGRFGLMDGAGIFSYNGLFPPQLSAWERIFLGWDEAFLVTNQTTTPINLPSVSEQPGERIAKIPISEDEYFLVENRHRDPSQNGVMLTIQKPDGTIEEISYNNQDSEFVYQESGFDHDLPPGVVIDVSHYDFSLPGGSVPNDESTSNRELNGGILIWHIDESIIRNTPEQTGINNNPERRAVQLMEADGAQDIGRPVTIGFFQNEINGSPFDFWWSGNNSSVITQNDTLSFYENRFGPDTQPNNNSNSGAPSFFEMYDFSDNSSIASFRIRMVNPYEDIYNQIDSKTIDDLITYTDSDNSYWQHYPLAMVSYESENEQWILIPGQNGLYLYNPETEELRNSGIETESLQQPLVSRNTELFTMAENPEMALSSINYTFYQWNGVSANEYWSFDGPVNKGFVSSSGFSIIHLDRTNIQANLADRELIELPNPIQQSEEINGVQSFITEQTLSISSPNGNRSFSLGSFESSTRKHTGVIEYQNGKVLVYLLTDGSLSLFRPEEDYSEQQHIHWAEKMGWPSIVDFTGNGYPEFLFIDEDQNQLIAKNHLGTTVDFFPINAPDGFRFLGTPLVADVTGDGETELIISAQDDFSQNIYVYNQNGDLLQGFPLYVGGISDTENESIHPLLFDNKLFTLSHTRDFKVWEFTEMNHVQWSTRYGNAPNQKITGRITIGETKEITYRLLNKEETYNWPNPATNETHLRYETSESADLSITITSLSGRTVYNRKLQSRGGLPEELSIDTSSWASGGYFAVVTAKANGQTERTVVKIAIAH